MDAREIGGRIRDRRERLKLTATYLADQVGVDISSVRHWELGDWRPSWENMSRLCEVLKCDLADLVGKGGRSGASIVRRSHPRKTNARKLRRGSKGATQLEKPLGS